MRAAVTCVVVAAAAAMAGCAGRFESFPFLLADGSRIDMTESPGRARDTEGILSSAKGETATPTYRLRKPAVVSADEEAFTVSYTSSLDSSLLTVFSADKVTLMRAALPATDRYTYGLQLPLPKGSGIWGFQVSSDSKQGSLKLAGAGIAKRIHGFSFGEGAVILDGSVTIRGMTPRSLDVAISADAWSQTSALSSAITVMLRPGYGLGDPLAPPEEIRVSFSGQTSSETRAFTVKAYPNARGIEFPLGAVGFIPRKLRMILTESSTGESGSSPLVRSVILAPGEDSKPIISDPGIVLDYLPSAWRSPQFELFVWDRFPRVLIFDTRDYDVQDDFFKRLAFFVEKPGYAGTIPDEGELSGKHGWNAHDYRAENLARFFSTAQKNGVALTAGETSLRRILMDNGVISQEDTGYQPGDGAVLSISRSSGAELRRLLLTHECFHGVFFSLSEFRDACFKAWDALSQTEKEAWIDFMEMTDYDTSNKYLVVNEFQSYLFQQPRGKVPAFQAATVSKLRKSFPQHASLFVRFQKEHSDSFLRSFDLLDRTLRAAGGPPGGEPLSVQAAP